VGAGYSFIDRDCGVRKHDGAVDCWTGPTPTPKLDERFGKGNVEIANGGFQQCGRSADGSVFCTQTTTYLVPGSAKVMTQNAQNIAGSLRAACAVKNGSVHCWGDNDNGELGRAPVRTGIKYEWLPAGPVEGLPGDVTSVVTSGRVMCATTAKGEVWCWGSNASGGLGTGVADLCSTRECKEAIHTRPQRVNLSESVVSLAGGVATCTLTKGHEVWCWGGNTFGQARQPIRSQPVTVEGETRNMDPEPTPLRWDSLGNDNQMLFSDWVNTCVIKFDGSLWCWGNNQDRQISTDKADIMPPTKMPDVCQ